MEQQLINPLTLSLKAHLIEALFSLKNRLISEGKKVFDFGLGDPTIPTAPFIVETFKNAVPEISQYPSIYAIPELKLAHEDYLKRRFHITDFSNLGILPTCGSKEAIFHLPLVLIGRLGRKTIAFPKPGYPVYEPSIKFAGGNAYPVYLTKNIDYEVRPWDFPKDVIKDLAALWVNYPHNPTGAMVSKEYWMKLIDWCHVHDVILLSDDCYQDIYDESLSEAPMTPLQLSTDRVISCMSLSKRSGMTGYRAGFTVGDSRIMNGFASVRARMGVTQQIFVSKAAAAAWMDDTHVKERRNIFTQRLKVLSEHLKEMGFIFSTPKSTLYLWAELPKHITLSDTDFALKLAETTGVIVSPASWLGDHAFRGVRFACVPTADETEEAMLLLKKFMK